MTNTDPERDEALYAIAAAIFGAKPDDPDETDEPERPSGWVGHEGTNPQSEANDLVALVQALFYPDPPE